MIRLKQTIRGATHLLSDLTSKIGATMRGTYRSVGAEVREVPALLPRMDHDGSRLLTFDESFARLRERGYHSTPKTGLGPVFGPGLDVDDILAGSPNITALVQDIQRKGWRIRYGDPGSGTWASHGMKTINLDGNLKMNPQRAASSLIHELDHANRPDPRTDLRSDPSLNRDEWVEFKVKALLRGEGTAILLQLIERKRILDNSGLDIGFAGGVHSDEYIKIGDRYLSGKIDEEQAVTKFSSLVMSDTPGSSKSTTTYAEYFRKSSERAWNALGYDSA
ncbi:hypothetical protein AB0M34_11335 [Nocardia sp. NPDC050193]